MSAQPYPVSLMEQSPTLLGKRGILCHPVDIGEDTLHPEYWKKQTAVSE